MKDRLEQKIFINSIIGTLVSFGIEKLKEICEKSNHNKISFPSSSRPIDILTYHKNEEFLTCSYKVGLRNGSLPDDNGALFDPKDIETREIAVPLDFDEIMGDLKNIMKK